MAVASTRWNARLLRPLRSVALLSDGELKAKIRFEVAGASKAAIEKVEKAGGSVTVAAKVQADTPAT